MIFIDSNIPMYLIGGPHQNKTDAKLFLEELVSRRERLVTDAEVLQEILHRYLAINRPDAIQPAFDSLLGIADEVFSIDKTAAERAKEIVLGHPRISARDAIHVAVMEKQRIGQIFSFDKGFDDYPGISRLP